MRHHVFHESGLFAVLSIFLQMTYQSFSSDDLYSHEIQKNLELLIIIEIRESIKYDGLMNIEVLSPDMSESRLIK